MAIHVRPAAQAAAIARTVALDDKVFRALGTLRFARLITSEDTLAFLSHLRLGVNLGRIKEIDVRTINELFLLTQPAHLQKLQGKTPGTRPGVRPGEPRTPDTTPNVPK